MTLTSVVGLMALMTEMFVVSKMAFMSYVGVYDVFDNYNIHGVHGRPCNLDGCGFCAIYNGLDDFAVCCSAWLSFLAVPLNCAFLSFQFYFHSLRENDYSI